MKQAPQPEVLVSLSVRVSAETARLLRESAASQDRPVAAHIRRLIKEHVDEYEAGVKARNAREAA